jgi:hypothetical protein
MIGSGRKKTIEVSVNHVQSTFLRNNNLVLLMNEMHGVLIHELTHAWQYFDRICLPPPIENDRKHTRAPMGLTEGIADFVRLRSEYAPRHWKKKKTGNWDAGYDSTAYFLDWIENEGGHKDFVRKVNFFIGKSGWDKRIVVDITGGKTMEVLWSDYVASF